MIRWFERGIAIAQRIIGTLGITGLSGSRVHIDSPVWHLNIWGVPAVTSEKHWLITVKPKRNRVIPWEVDRISELFMWSFLLVTESHNNNANTLTSNTYSRKWFISIRYCGVF